MIRGIRHGSRPINHGAQAAVHKWKPPMSNDAHYDPESQLESSSIGSAEAPSEITEWDPRSEAVLQNQIAAYDRMRQTCPLARSPMVTPASFVMLMCCKS